MKYGKPRFLYQPIPMVFFLVNINTYVLNNSIFELSVFDYLFSQIGDVVSALLNQFSKVRLN